MSPHDLRRSRSSVRHRRHDSGNAPGGGRRFASLLVAAGIALLVTSVAGVASADASSLGVFDVTANATGVGASFGDPTSQPYPVAAGLAPNTVAQLGSGPSGQAQASILWPGPLLGNAGTLANVIGTPLPPEVVSNANYPVVARASAGAGGSDEQTVGPMTAKVEGSDSRSSTVLTNFDAPGVVTAAKVVTTSHSYVDNGRATAVGESVLEGVTVGPLQIARIHTIARGATDGVAATTSQEVTLSGATVNGQAVTIDRDGIHAGSGTVPVAPVLGGAKPALDGFGIKAFLSDPRAQKTSGGAAALESGSLIVEWSPPSSGQYFVVVLGGSSVTMRATPGTDLGVETGGFFAPSEPTAVLPTPSFSPPSESGTPAPSSSRTAPAPSPAARPGVAAPFQSGPSLDLTSSVTDRPPFGWVLIGVLGAILLGAGLHSLRNQALVTALVGTSCPLERR